MSNLAIRTCSLVEDGTHNIDFTTIWPVVTISFPEGRPGCTALRHVTYVDAKFLVR